MSQSRTLYIMIIIFCIRSVNMYFDCQYVFQNMEGEREWARDIWNEWFDEVFPPEAEEEDDSDEG